MMGKVIVIGSSNTDMVITSSRIPRPGETVMGNEFAIIAGGKGANQAVAAARAGAQVSFIAKVGADDFGRKAIESYRQDGINTQYIFSTPKATSGIALIVVEESSGQNSIVVAPGANAELSPDDIESVADQIADADVLLIQLEIPIETVRTALTIALQHGVLTILNPAPFQPLDDHLLSLVDIITPNETEFAGLAGIDPNDNLAIMESAAQIMTKINQMVLITLGEKGAYYLNKAGKEHRAVAPKVEARDTTAAGDVFNGYLAAALADRKPHSEAIRIAVQAASISVTRKGAQPAIPYRTEIADAG